MKIKNYQDFIQMNESIRLYSEFLKGELIYESTQEIETRSKSDINVARISAERGDYSKVSKIFKNVITKTGAVAVGLSILFGVLQGTVVDISNFKKSLQDEGVEQSVIKQVVSEIDKTGGNLDKGEYKFSDFESSRSQIGYDLTKKIKELDKDKEVYKKTPCYEYTFKYMMKLNPEIDSDILQHMKMSYDKDVNSMKASELRKLSETSLTDQTPMKDLNWINKKYGVGKIVESSNDIQVGDIINFWIYDLIEFSPNEGNYSYPDTENEFKKYTLDHKVNPNDWFIESAKLVYGHYAVISDIDSEYIYLSSSGEKAGPNGIWNGVPKGETDEFFTKIRISDLSLSKLDWQDIKFKRTDDITNKRSRIPLRVSILHID